MSRRIRRSVVALLLVAALVSLSVARLAGQAGEVLVATYAGTGEQGGADGPADGATFDTPAGVALDAAGNLYVSEGEGGSIFGGERIRKIATDGTVTTLAGMGKSGFADGPGASARFYAPGGLAVDAAGTVYVADQLNYRIRVVAPDGTVRTLAGTGHSGHVDGPATVAEFSWPTALALDGAGSLYVVDFDTAAVRVVAPDGAVRTLAQTGLKGPVAIAVDAAGTVYVASTNNHVILTIGPDGSVETLAGGEQGYQDGPAASARFSFPAGIAVDAEGVVYVADAGNERIRAIAPDGTVSTVAGDGSRGYLDGAGTLAQFNAPATVSLCITGVTRTGESEQICTPPELRGTWGLAAGPHRHQFTGVR